MVKMLRMTSISEDFKKKKFTFYPEMFWLLLESEIPVFGEVEKQYFFHERPEFKTFVKHFEDFFKGHNIA